MSAHAPAVGVALAVVGALAWASNYLLIRMGIERQGVSDVVLVAVLCQAAVVVPVTAVVHYPNFGLTPTTVGLFVAAGLASGLFGRVCQYSSTRRIGASRTSPIVASAGLVSAALAIWLLDEQVTPAHLLGIVLVVVGVAAASWETASDADAGSWRAVGTSLVFPLTTAALFGVEPIFVKLGLERGTPALVGLAVMAVSAATSFLAYRRARGPVRLGRALTWPDGRYSLGAGVVGAVAYLAYLAALSVAPVVVVLPVFQTTPLLVVGLSLVFMPRHLERVTWRLAVAAAVVVVGATLVSLAA